MSYTTKGALLDLPEVEGLEAVLARFPGGLLGFEFARGRAARQGMERQFNGAINRAAWAAGRATARRRVSLPSERYVRVAASAIKRVDAMMQALYPDGSRRLA